MAQEGELFPEREVVLDQPEIRDEQADALRAATDRAERAEAELARLKNAATHPAKSQGETHAAKSQGEGHTTHGGGAHAIPAGSDSELKSPPSPSTRDHQPAGASARAIAEDAEAGKGDAVSELRNDPMMVHLLDSLDAGKDIGHYGRLVFAMVARHFLPHEEVIGWMTRDQDFSEEQAQLMLRQVEGRDYNPPKRDRILQWQKEQEFPIIPNVDDPDSGNLYRNLKFPDEIYQHIGHYQEKKVEAEESEREESVQF